MEAGWGSCLRGTARGTDMPGRMDRCPRKLLQGQDHNNTMDTNLDPHLPVTPLRLTAASSS